METTALNIQQEVQEVADNTIEQPAKYQLRDLEACDVFLMAQIIKGIGITEFKDVFSADRLGKMVNGSDSAGDELLREVGVDVAIELAGIVIGNLPKCEQSVYKFISSLSNVTPQEIEHMPMNDFFEIIIEIIRKREFVDFIKVVSRLFK